ncbi:MAG: Na(+)-translocating NADH-quinone reductase subunit A [Flavobacteriales bacterium]|nr:Na(+)-translocating NADH-quinone reductase subunit A [Flavobacteriales bacterium]
MPEEIRIKKGLDIKLLGEAQATVVDTSLSDVYSVYPDDFYNITPKLLVKKGDEVKAGTPIFYSKADERIKVCSPVSGVVDEVVRGAKRKILSINIRPSSSILYAENTKLDVSKSSTEEIKQYFSETGLIPFIQQRPYGTIANFDDTPKEIVISAYNSAPLASDLSFVLSGKEKEVQAAVSALAKLTSGKVHITTDSTNKVVNSLKDAEIYYAKGSHPVGNVSVQIEKISPLNKGEKIWTVNAEDLVVIGEMILTGKFNLERLISVVGPRVSNPRYHRVLVGTSISDIVANNIVGDNNRYIDGNVLTGKKSSVNGALGYYSKQITVIEEGDDYQFFGWQTPQPKKFSITRALMFSFLTPNKKYDLNTNTNGEHRAFVLTGYLEKVFPQNIYPLELIKACLAKDLDKMEKLGIYEVVPEDFALTEFIDVSKNNHQQIIKEAIDLMIKEVG